MDACTPGGRGHMHARQGGGGLHTCMHARGEGGYTHAHTCMHARGEGATRMHARGEGATHMHARGEGEYTHACTPGGRGLHTCTPGGRGYTKRGASWVMGGGDIREQWAIYRERGGGARYTNASMVPTFLRLGSCIILKREK